MILIIPLEKAIDKSKLVRKQVDVTRGGKTFKQMKWVRPGGNESNDKGKIASPSKAGDPLGFRIGEKVIHGKVKDTTKEGAVVDHGGKDYLVKWKDITPKNDSVEVGKQEKAKMGGGLDRKESPTIKKLLSPDNQRKIDKKLLVQPSGDIDTLYKLAEEARGDFKEYMEKAKKDLGAKELLSRPVLKSKERVKEKMAEDGVQDAKQIYDLDGHTLIFNDLDGLSKALDYFMKDPNVLRIKNNFANPSPAGYRDININIKLPNGMISEIQINTEAMMVAKEEIGHYFYEVEREAGLATPPPPPPPPAGTLQEGAKKVYGFAWDVSQGKREVANLKASLFGIARPFSEKSAGVITESQGSSWLSPKTRKRFIDFVSKAKGVSSISKNSKSGLSKSIMGKSSYGKYSLWIRKRQR